MSVKPNFIPRTLIGAGGVRLIDLPGVVYPKEMLQNGRAQRRGTRANAYDRIPSWGISTPEAAQLLHCSCPSARMLLHRRRVHSRLVETRRGVQTLYWRREVVEQIAAQRAQIATKAPARMVDAEQAVNMLEVGRSTLYRYVKKHLLHEKKLRILTDRGTRLKTFYPRAEVAKLAAQMRAIRAHQRELDRLLKLRGLV